MRSGLPDSPSSRLVGRNLGFHPARLVFGLFDEPQDAHMVYPITAHAMSHQHDEDGGFVIEATTIHGPDRLRDDARGRERAAVGQTLVETLRALPPLDRRARDGRTTTTTAACTLDEDGDGVVRGGVHAGRARAHERRARLRREVLAAAGATERLLDGADQRRTCRGRAAWAATPSGRSSTPTAQSWDVKRLYVGDGSLVPRTLSVNPSLTIMALADRLADHLDADPHGYLA